MGTKAIYDTMADSGKSTRPFTFDVSFDPPRFEEAEPEPVLETEAAPPVFSLKDLEDARQEGFRDGHQEALEAATSSVEERVARCLETASAKLGNLAAEQEARQRALEALSIDLMRRILEQTMPATAAKHGFDEIESVLRTALPLIADEAKLVLRVHSETADAVKQRFDELLAETATTAEINVVADETLGPTDCAMDWGDGGVERNLDTLWREIDRILTEAQAASGGAIPDGNSGNSGNNDTGAVSADTETDSGPVKP
jgi:flagellar assembly protein FliH